MWPTELVNLPSAALLRAVLLGVTVVSGLQYGVERRHPQVHLHFVLLPWLNQDVGTPPQVS